MADAAAARLPRVWVDAQLPPAMAGWLAQDHGVEAVHVVALGLAGASDSEIFERARADAVVVMTKDQDFVQLLERHGPPPRVIWITTGNVRNRDLRDVFRRHWPRIAELLLVGAEPLIEIGQAR